MTKQIKSLQETPERLVGAAAEAVGNRFSRRGFLVRAAVVGSAISIGPLRYFVRRASAAELVTTCSGCSSGSFCCDGYTSFCCTINSGNNTTCPSGCIVGGFWYAYVGTNYCNSQPYPGRRWYIDCVSCCGTCQCYNNSCGNRETCCHYSNYGQCNGPGTVKCRLVRCVDPCRDGESEFSSCSCDDSTVDQNTCCQGSSSCTWNYPTCSACGGQP